MLPPKYAAEIFAALPRDVIAPYARTNAPTKLSTRPMKFSQPDSIKNCQVTTFPLAPNDQREPPERR